MSGHSKWSTIKRKKGKADAARGKAFSKLIKEITVVARMGGGDESANPHLRQVIDKAKSINMPAANIEKAIKKGTGELPGVVYEEVHYEGYGPGGVAVLLEGYSDNKNRTVAEVRHLFSKYNGNLGENGCVAFMFEKKGIVVVENWDKGEDALFEIALEGGAQDLSFEDGTYEIEAATEDLEGLKKYLDDNGVVYESAELTMVPTTTTKVPEKKLDSVIKLLEALEDHEDVQNVYSNFDLEE